MPFKNQTKTNHIIQKSKNHDTILIIIQNQELIRVGLDYLNKAAEGSELSEYHIEAAIAAQRAIAEKFEDTNWEQILNLYNLLLHYNSSPVVLLNRAIVISKIDGAKSAISEIRKINEIEKLIDSNYLFSSVLGEMYKADNNSPEALKYFEKALHLTQAESEKKLLQRKISLL